MKSYQQQLAAHPIHGTIRQLRELLTTAELHVEDPTVRMRMDKAAALVEYADQCVRALIPELVNFESLSAAQQHIQNVSNEIGAYAGNRNAGHLTNAASNADQAMTYLVRLAIIPNETVSGALTAILASHRTATDHFIAALSRQRDKLQAELTATKEQIAKQDQAISQAKEIIEAQKNALGAELVSLKNEFSELKAGWKESAATQKNEASAGLLAFKEQFSGLKSSWQDSAKQLFDAFSSSYAEVVKSGESARDNFLEESERKADEILVRLASLQAEAEKTTGAIGVTGLVGSYQTSADQEQNSANLFRWIALGIMGVAALVLAATLIEMAFYGLDWKPALVRLIGALILSFPGGYCAAESSRHRKAASRARRFEMELSSLSAYLATMPVEQVNQLKLQLSSRFFGREEPDEKSGAVMPLDKFIDLATEMAKRK